MRKNQEMSNSAGGSDRVCGITANEDADFLWWCVGRRPDVYLQDKLDKLFSSGCFRWSIRPENRFEHVYFTPIHSVSLSRRSLRQFPRALGHYTGDDYLDIRKFNIRVDSTLSSVCVCVSDWQITINIRIHKIYCTVVKLCCNAWHLAWVTTIL